jgi:hypothetical protein
MPKGMKVEFSVDFEKGRLTESEKALLIQVVQRCNSNILGIVWWGKLKLTGIVVRDVKLTKRIYLQPASTASTHTTSTVARITTSITTNA